MLCFSFLSECAPSSSFYVVLYEDQVEDRHGLYRSGFKLINCNPKTKLSPRCMNFTFCMTGTHSDGIGECIPCPAGNFNIYLL